MIVLDHLSGRRARRAAGRALRVAAQGAVVTAVVGGTIVYTHRNKDVTLVLDGRPVSVQAAADDVRSLLEDEGVTIGTRDVVVPSLDARVIDGQRVVVRFARPLTVTVDGVPRTYWTTELTVDAALEKLRIPADGTRMSASRSTRLGRDGLKIVLSHPKNVTIATGGRIWHVTTTASTVSELLAEQNVALRASDQLSTLPASPVVEGLVVGVTRIDRRRVTVTETVPAPVTRRPSPDLAAGTQRVVTPGRPGRRTATYSILLVGGQEAARELISQVVLKKPVSRVIRVGTKRDPSDREADGATGGTPTRTSVGGDVDSLNWTALARCESGGNPRAVNPAGYYGLYQFSSSTWRSVGGRGLPTGASASEQLYRAKLLYKRGGAGQWGCGRHLYD